MSQQELLTPNTFTPGTLFRRGFLFAVVALALTGAPPAFAQCSDSWTGSGGDSNWSDGANWSNGVAPGNSDNACIQSGGASVVLDVNGVAATLNLGSSDSLTLPTVTNASPNLNINGSSISNSGQIIMSAPVSFGTTGLSLTSGGTVTLSGKGTITLNANSFGGDYIGGSALLLNQSTIQGAGAFDMTFNNSSKGVINANESGFQLVMGRNQSQGASTNTGLMEATNGGQLAMGSLTLNNVGGTISASGSGSFINFTNEGQGGQTITGGTFATSSGGVIYSGNSTTLDGTNGNTIANKGTLAVNVTSNVQGTINNTGTFQILSNSGQAGVNIPGGQTFTLMGSGSLTMGDGTANAYNNQNFISGATLVNQQLIQGTGGILNLSSFNNSGIINANVQPGANNLQLQLGRAGASLNTGTIEASNGGVLLIGSTTINNVGGSIVASGDGSNVSLVGSLGTSGLTISGGAFDTSGGGVIYGQGGSLLDGTTNTVTNSGTMIINSGDLQAQGTLNNNGTIQILAPTDDNGQTFLQIPDNGNNLTVTGKGVILMGDGTDNSYNNNAAIGNNLGTNGTFDNRSTVEGTGGIVLTAGVTNDGAMIANVPTGSSGLMLYVDRVGNIQNNGTIRATNGGVFYIGGGGCCGNPFTNASTIIADANSTVDLENANPFGNLANGVLTGGTYKVTGKLQIPGNVTTNAATIALTGAASQVLNPNTDALTGFVTNAATGIFEIAAGRNFTSSATFTNHGGVGILKGSTFTVGAGGSYVQAGGRTVVDGTLTASGGGSIKIAKGGLFGNGGNIVADVYSGGTVIPANSSSSTGKLLITGGYAQTSAGALDSNLAGSGSGQFSQLNVNGTASLHGTLNIKLLKNYVPLIGTTFQILRAQHMSGNFTTVNGTSINDNEHFTVTYNSNNVTLTVVSGRD